MSLNKKVNRTKNLSSNTSSDFSLRVPRAKNNFAMKRVEDTGKILKYIDDNIIGKGLPFLGPFGRRKVVYADYSSSGRSLQFIEDYIIKEILPTYGDISCTSAVTGLQSQLYFNEARELVRSAVNATKDDEIIFCENACISPIERITYVLCSQDNNNNNSNNSEIEHVDNTILFVSTSEPDKNLLPWIDIGVQIERISKNRNGYLDLVELEKKLCNYKENKNQLIGLFSASSRVTGILADDVATTILLHQYGAISIWDYGPTAPSSLIDVNPALPGATKDIVFFCGNKYIGGAQAPGVLIIKKSLLNDKCQYIYDNVGVIEAVRAGLVIQLKEALGTQTIMNENEKICKLILSHIRTIPEIVLLGSSCTTTKRLPTLCFLVRHPRSTFLHHRFVVAILNDVFGIQATAINNIVEAMGITNKLTVEYERLLADDSIAIESIRPGYTQITLPFFMSETEISFIMEALKMVATEAWKLLPQYDVDNGTGEWKHSSNALLKERKCLSTIRYTDGKMIFTDRKMSGLGYFPQSYADCLQTARNIFNRARKMAQRTPLSNNIILKLSKASAETLRWYMLSGEAHELLLGRSHNVKQTLPFDPNNSLEPPSLFNMHRHNSLSALDVKIFKSKSVPTSPVHSCITRQQSTPSPTGIPEDETSNILHSSLIRPAVRFSLGGEVTTIPSISPAKILNLSNEISTSTRNRNRCNSWSSNVGALNSLSPQTQINLGFSQPLKIPKKERLCSCSSQTEMDEYEYLIVNNLTTSTPSLHLIAQAGSSSNSISSDSGDIQAYIKGVTNELATEIKSEIREVISKVEDVLENTDSSVDMSLFNLSSFYNANGIDEFRNDSVSATDVAQYLKEYSKEMTNEVKSEIREVVNVMNENEQQNIVELQNTTKRRYSPSEISKLPSIETLESSPITPDTVITEKPNHRHSDILPQINHDNKLLIDNKQRSESFPHANHPQKYETAKSPESSTPNCPYTGTISKLIDSVGTMSQDSGINMNFHEHDDSTKLKSTSLTEPDLRHQCVTSSRSQLSENIDDIFNDSKNNNNNNNNNCSKQFGECLPSAKVQTNKNESDRKNNAKRDSSDSDIDRNGEYKWQHLPNAVWKQTAEAIDEYDMIKDGDRILVCLSGSSASLCLLHSIRQFTRARGIHIEMAAATIGEPSVDPRALMLYLQDLDIKYYIDQLGTTENLRRKLIVLAQQKGYNVLAFGNSLDKLADEFLIGLLQKGRLKTTQANFYNRDEDIRIIRPFIYVRERQLEDFAIQKDLPTCPSKLFTRPPDSLNSILKVQEVINPNVYDNIKNALRPLLSLRIEATKSSFDNIKLASMSRE